MNNIGDIMTRLIEKDATGPIIVKKSDINGDIIAICNCGLSTNKYNFCDGSHAVTKNEPDDVLVMYERDESGKLIRNELNDDSEDCGDGCCRYEE